MGAVSRRGLTRGLVSRPFSAAALERAAAAAAPDTDTTTPTPTPTPTVFVDVDAEGYLCTGGPGGGGGGERVAARARLAPHVHAANVVLTRDTSAARGVLRLRVERPTAPLDELLLWFDEELLAALHLPYLTLGNIRGRKEYECEECAARFEEPNPLKTHLFLRCAPVTPQRLWRVVAARLARPPSPASPAPAHTSAFRRVASGASAGGSPPSAPDALAAAWAARLEAAAAEWGRARGGHACLYCGKLYSRKYGLKIHLRTHTGYRPLRCRHCARAFGDPSNLNKHVRLHAAAAAGAGGGAAGVAARGTHACSRCGKLVARRRDLERHMRARCALASPPAPATAAP